MTITVEQARENALAARREELLTVKELADMWRVHEQTIYGLIRRRRINGVLRIGREIRIDITVACRQSAA
jgi:excisionase family DNA binding protein